MKKPMILVTESLTSLWFIPHSTFIFLKRKYKLNFLHNPEFLTAATAFDDFHNQKHIVLGKHKNTPQYQVDDLEHLYKTHYPDAEISLCDCLESEQMKIFCNCFYSVKVQFFNELYLTCKANNSNYDKVKDLMLKNNWINKMHTNVPGPDGQLSYGGYCFPKDTNALAQYMETKHEKNQVLKATIKERNEMRSDHTNVKKK